MPGELWSCKVTQNPWLIRDFKVHMYYCTSALKVLKQNYYKSKVGNCGNDIEKARKYLVKLF